MKKRLFSGIQPTGEIHIGNYLGAIENWIRLQDRYNAIFCIVDYHAITIPIDPKTFAERILETAATLFACGVDPDRAVLFLQSDIPQHTELAWIFNSMASMSRLSNMTQFKQKAEQHEKQLNAGLFTYPVLQAADILLYKAEVVPVGDDQLQHLELTREIARSFNQRYGVIFPEPDAVLTKSARIIGLDGVQKMSKSLGNHIALNDSPEQIQKKLAGAFTDPARKRRTDPGRPEVCNVFSLHREFSTQTTVAEIDRDCRQAVLGCFDCKRKLADAIGERLSPIREAYASLRAKPDELRDRLQSSAAKIRPIAEETLDQVRACLGLTMRGAR